MGSAYFAGVLLLLLLILLLLLLLILLLFSVVLLQLCGRVLPLHPQQQHC